MTKFNLTTNLKEKFKKGELSKLPFFYDDLEQKNWAYDGSLMDSIDELPLDIKRIIPFDYILKNGVEFIAQKETLLIDHHFSNESATDVMKLLSSKFEHINIQNTFTDLCRYLTLLSVELVRNAILLNTEDSASRECHYKLFENEKFLTVEITDYYGLMTSQSLLMRLKHVKLHNTYEMKKSGAGLGFYLIINSVNSIMIEIDEKKMTRITVNINKYKRLKDFKEKQTAIFIKNMKEL